jgi:hypothetical protein
MMLCSQAPGSRWSGAGDGRLIRNKRAVRLHIVRVWIGEVRDKRGVCGPSPTMDRSDTETWEWALSERLRNAGNELPEGCFVMDVVAMEYDGWPASGFRLRLGLGPCTREMNSKC